MKSGFHGLKPGDALSQKPDFSDEVVERTKTALGEDVHDEVGNCPPESTLGQTASAALFTRRTRSAAETPPPDKLERRAMISRCSMLS
jgi:hypothetical protein